MSSKPIVISKSPVLEIMEIAIHKIQEKHSENEAKKSPEQRIIEAQQSRDAIEINKLEKIKTEQNRVDQLFKDWLKRDTWLIYDEAMLLITGKKPEEESLLFSRDAKLWGLVQSCIGISLSIVNINAKAKQWRVKPLEWVRWLKEKEQSIHPQLEIQVFPKTMTAVTSKTFIATTSRSQMKAARQSALKTFVRQIEELAKKKNSDWNSQEIPVTKRDFLEVFYKENTAIKKISRDSFDRDIADIKIKFKKGTKNNKNNVLIKLFKVE